MKKCEKCSYEGEEVSSFKDINLCSVCRKFAPYDSEKFKKYLNEKINWRELESFRKFMTSKNFQGMKKKAKLGRVMNRAPFGYKIEDKKLIPDPEKMLKVEKIFRTFLNNEISLNQLSKRFGFSVNGIKKILKNFTYIGKVKFDGEILPGNHKPLISQELFNKVQSKLDKI
jgi:hypothetical protein